MSVRYFVATLAVGVLVAFSGTGSRAAHDMGQDCYVCHTLSAKEVVPSTRSITTEKSTGTVSGSSVPLRCDYCHTGFQSRFTNVNVSGHPVQIITGDNSTGVQVPSSVTPPTAKILDCRDCHQGNTKAGGYIPDLAPQYYAPNGIGAGGYPDHDFLGTMDNTTVGDPPHLGTYPDNVNRTYTKVPTSVANLNTNFDLCFSCHNNSGKTTSTKNIQADFQAGGHYFKTGSTGTWTFNAGDRVPCSDCHASHASATNKFNFGPDPATFSGTAPTGKTTSRAICLTCHNGYGATASTVTLRGRAPTARSTTVTEHGGLTGSGSTAPCSDCHNAHNPPAGGNNCLDCHRTGGPVSARHQGADLEFPADGIGGEDLASIQFSGHKGVIYNATDNYVSKTYNECKKCHGLSHPSHAAKVQKADDNTIVYSTGFVYGLSYNPANGNWSANPASFADGDGDGIIDGNGFCLSCHDGADAVDPVGKSNIRIGGVDPPKVYYPQGGGSTGHDRKSGLAYNVTNNPAGQQLCTSCHKYHTSDRPQLFPGNTTFNSSNSRTFSMPTWGGTATTWQAPQPATSAFPSNAGRIQIGNRFADTGISYADNTSPPSGKGFGTAGSSRTATDGLCDACHRDAGTVTGNTLNRAHTHEGDGSSYGSGNVFRKDCLECHDPHGGGPNPNIAMIRERVGRDNTSLNTVTFTARTGANSFDESESPLPEANADDLCATCHNNPPITHNFRTQSSLANHMQGGDCTQCHQHGDNTVSGKYGFPQGNCNSCHGSDSGTGMPASGDAGTYHPDANNIVGTRGADNSVHKVHVNYLVKRGVTDTATICATCHVGGGGFEQHPGNPVNRSFKSGPMPDNQYLQVSLSDGYRIPGDNAVSATGYRGRPGTAAGAVNGWKTCVTTCHQGASPSWAAVTQVSGNTMTFTLGDNAAPASVPVNSTRNRMLKFSLAGNRVAGTDNQVSWGGITVRRTGTGADNAVTAVRIYDDGGTVAGTFDSGDIEIGSGVFVNGIAAITFPTDEIITDNAAVYYVGYDIAWSAPDNVTVGARVENVGSFRLTSADNMNGAFPVSSTLATTQNIASDIVTVTGNSTAADNVLQGATDDLLRFRLRIGRGNADNAATCTGVTITLSGSALPSDIDNVFLYKDNNANGNWDNTDTVLGSAAPAGQQVAIAVPAQTITPTLSPYYFVVFKLKPTAEWGQTAGAQLASNLAFTLGGSDQVATEGFPMTSNEAEILDVPDRLTIAVASTAPANLFQGGSDDLLKLTASANQDSVEWTGLVVTHTGSGVPVDNVLDSLYVYKDSNADNTWQASDALLGYALPQAGATQTTVNFFSPETVSTASANYFVVYKMKAGATEGKTVGARIVDNSAVLIAGAADTKTVPGGSSGLATVTALVDTVTVAGDNTIAPNYPLSQGVSKDFLRFNLRVTSGFGDNAATFTAAQISLGGTVSPTDIDNVILYKDANGDNTWQATDNVVGSAVPAGSQVTINVPSQAVGASQATPYYFVVVKPKATADWTKTVGARLQDNGAITLGNPADRVTGTFPLASANAQITDVPDRLTMTVDNVAPVQILRGTSGAFLRLTPSLDHDSVTWDNLVVTMTGTNPSADIDNVIVYRDANGNIAWEPTDNVIGWKSPSGSVVTVNLSPQTLTQGTPPYFVVFHIAPGANAGDNVAARIADNTAIQIEGTGDTKTLAPSPAFSTNARVSLPADTVSAAGGDMGPPGSMPQGSKAAFLWFTTQVTTVGQDNAAALRSISVAVTGTSSGAVGSVIDNVIVYKDANGNNTWETSDNVVGYTPSPSASPVTVTFPADQAVGGTASPRYFVVFSLKSAADWTRTVGAQIPSEQYYGIVPPDQMGPAAAVSSAIVSIQDNTDKLTLSGVDVAPSSIAQGADNAFLRLTPSVDRDSVAWTGLVVTKTGSLPVSEIDSVTVYKDANGDNTWQATDNIIGSAVPAGQDNVTVNFSATETIGTGSNPSYFVVFKVMPTATAPSTIGARLTDNSAVLISGAQDTRGLVAPPISSSLATVLNRIPPGGVTGFAAVPGGGQVLLRWTNPPDADMAGTRILYRLDPFPVPTGPNDGNLLVDKAGTANAADNTTHTGVINNIDYYYAAMAYDTAGNISDNVSTAQATPRANWYLRNTPASDPVTGRLMDHVIPTAGTPQTVNVTSKKTGDLPIGSSWVGANPMGLGGLPAGTWTFNLYGYKSNPDQQGVWKVKVYARVGGINTWLFDSTDNVVIPSASSLRSWSYSAPAFSSALVPPSAKLYVEFYVNVPVRVQGKYYLEYDGTSKPSNFLPSFTVVAPAPARETGGGTPIACNSCHQFGPVDNAASLAGGGYIDNGNLQYYVQDRGSHPAHGMINRGVDAANPVGTDAANTCTICHLPETGTPALFGYDHATGAVDIRSTGIGSRTANPSYSDNGTYDGASRTCSTTYCHAGMATPSGGPNGSWGYGSASGLCNVCHAYTLTPAVPRTAAHARHDNTAHNNGASSTSPTRAGNAGGYSFSCSYCHFGTGHVNYPVSSLQAAEVIFGGTLGGVANVGTGASYAAGAAVAGAEGGKLNYTNGTCTVYCHSNANPFGGTNVYDNVSWGGTVTCGLSCHGGNKVSASPIATGSHTRHVSGANLSCGKCHSGTVNTSSDTTITSYDNHVNGYKNVKFSADVGGSASYDNSLKRCSATYCHGTGSSPAWGSGPIANCSVCHQSQGAGGGTRTFTGAHQTHMDNSSTRQYMFACEVCHAWNASAASNGTHAGGDNNASGPRTVQVLFTDNGMSGWVYGGAGWTFDSANLWSNPYGAATPSPSYADNAGTAGTDSMNASITWSAGTCGNAWCHSNANPASAGGGANTYRAPTWTPGTVTCTSCHLGADVQSNMLSAPDRMSQGHLYHISTDTYRYTCDECHANTVANDCTVKILDPGGYAYHVNGNKKDILGSSSVNQTSVINSSLLYDNNLSCSAPNNYCHSNGQRQSPPFTSKNPTFVWTWNAIPSYGCGSANQCHASNLGSASVNFAAVGDNSAHLKHAYNCFACHYETISGPGYYGGRHANAVKDVTINSVTPNIYDNDTISTNNYDLPAKTCSGITCHGGNSVSWTDNTLTCASCHTTTNGAPVTVPAYNYTYTAGTPNMSTISPSYYSARGHGRNGALPWGAGKNPALLFGRTMVCLDCHDKNVLHNVSTNLFRFRATINGRAVTFDNVDTVCYACHDSAAVKEHSKAVTGGGASGWDHQQKCVDCHDVHGQANIFMVYDNIVYQDNTAAAYATSNAYGIPYYPASRATVVFGANAAGSDYANSIVQPAGPYTGVCEVCHERTSQYQRNTANGKAGPQGHYTDKCGDCHTHGGGFKGTGCATCHGDQAAGTFWPDNTASTLLTYYPDRAGQHLNHMKRLGERKGYGTTPSSYTGTQQRDICSFCHDDLDSGLGGVGPLGHYVTNYTKANAPADVRNMKYMWSPYDNDANDAYSAATYSGDTWTGGSTCSTVDCHNNVLTPAWYGSATVNCSLCHSSTGISGSGEPWPDVGAHGAHDNAYTISTGVNDVAKCANCHAGYVPSSIDCVATLGTHIDNNRYQVKVPDVAGAYLSKGAASTSFSPAGASGKCSNVSCHGGIQTPAWDNAGSINVGLDSGCRTCHVVDAQPVWSAASQYNAAWSGLHGRTGSVSGENHTSADNSAGDRTDSSLCTQCHGLPTLHYSGLDNTATDPVDNFVTTYNGVGGSLSAAGCAVTCHSDSDGTTSRWLRKWSSTVDNTNGAECANCHGLFGAWVGGVTHRDDANMRNMHGGQTAPPDFGCNECHGWNSAQYDFSPKWDNTLGQPSHHGDEKIQMNDNTSNVARNGSGLTGCSGCHNAYDGAATPNHSFTTVNRWTFVTITDGSFSGACNDCHSYPNMAGGQYTKAMSAVHAKHAGTPSGVVNSKAYLCAVCHFGAYPAYHNQSRVFAGGVWPAGYKDNVSIQFDPSLNPVNGGGTLPTYGGVLATGQFAPGDNSNVGICAGLYCHGGNGNLNVGWGGIDNTPRWDNTTPITCGDCHKADSALAQGNHPAHLAAAFGPLMGNTCSGTGGCHTDYALNNTTKHADGNPTFQTAPGSGIPADNLSVSGICNNCHSTYTSGNIPTSGTNLGKSQWSNTSYKLPCVTCHNGGGGTQAYANLNGTGGRAAAIEGTYYAKGHGDNSIDVPGGAAPPLACNWCHGATDGHIGSNRPVGTNPWRLSVISSYSLRGRVDQYCATDICHSAGANHWWRVDPDPAVLPSDNTRAATDTHPTTTPAVPTSPIDKSRWFQVPLDNNIPLQGSLTDNSYNKSGGASNHIVCVSCHDPHGVGTSPTPTRSFSGANTEANPRMLRFDYSGSGDGATPLCAKCHK